MNKISTMIPNAVVLVMDDKCEDIPRKSHKNSVVSLNSTCIAIFCKPDIDGEVSISLSEMSEFEESSGHFLIYEGILNIASGFLTVCTVLFDKLIYKNVSECKLKIKIYANTTEEPDNIIIKYYIVSAGAQMPPLMGA